MGKASKRGELVTAADGRKWRLVEREEAGLVPCTGEAHDPAVGGMIDNCGLCAPRWGEMMSYKPIPFSALRPGVAIAASATGRMGSEARAAFEREAAAAGAALVMVTKKHRGGGRTSFFAWVCASDAESYDCPAEGGV